MGSKEYFDDVAGQWDSMRKGFFDESVREKAFSTAGIQSGKKAADIGAGTGFLTAGLLENGLSVIAVDQSAEMLNIIDSKYCDAAVVTRTGEAESLPVKNGEVDYAFANMYLHHVENPAAAIHEMARIVKPGGIVVITDLDKHSNRFLLEEHRDRWAGFERSDIKMWLEHAGLRDVFVDCVGSDCCAESDDGSDSAEISIFIASGNVPFHRQENERSLK